MATNPAPPIWEPADIAELADLLADADRRRLAVIPRGGGTKQEWGNSPRRADAILSTSRLHRVIEHAWGDMTVTVEAGCTIGELQRILAEHGQRLAIDVLWPDRATVGGILATNDSGVLRLRFGSLRDLIIGVTIALPDGTIAMSGGKVVKNVAGYDLPKLMTGALGTLGVITQAVFRLHPLPQGTQTLTLTPPDLAAAQRSLLAIQNSQLAHAALQLRSGSGSSPQLDILLEGTEVGIAAQAAQIRLLAGKDQVHEGQPDIWNARQQLWPCPHGSAIAKFSVLPSSLADAILTVQQHSNGPWSVVAQATGIGCVRMSADWLKVRSVFEKQGGSLVLLTPVEKDEKPLDAWGSAGDAVPLMRLLKQQFDPKATLNPGRFVGDI